MNEVISNVEEVTLAELYAINEATGIEFVVEDGAVRHVVF